MSAGYESAAAAARAFGWNSNTYRAHEGGFNGLKKAAAEKYGAAFKVKPEWLMFGEAGASGSVALIETGAGDAVPVIAEIAAGVWQEAEEMAASTETIPFIPHPRFPHAMQRALKIRGDSCDQIAPDGSYVNTVPLEAALPVDGLEGLLRQAEVAGRDLIVVAERNRSGLFEATLKALVRTPKGLHLEARSSNPRWTGTIPFRDEMLGEEDETRITRVVIGKYETTI